MSEFCRRCSTCSSPRKGERCWKCGAATFVPDASWTEPELPPVDLIRKLAKEAGYAIGEHGSKERDLDLIAAPWVDDCDDAIDLMVHIADGVGGKLIGTVEKKPHGRLGCNIQMDGWYKLIDLSVLPRVEVAPDIRVTINSATSHGVMTLAEAEAMVSEFQQLFYESPGNEGGREEKSE